MDEPKDPKQADLEAAIGSMSEAERESMESSLQGVSAGAEASKSELGTMSPDEKWEIEQKSAQLEQQADQERQAEASEGQRADQLEQEASREAEAGVGGVHQEEADRAHEAEDAHGARAHEAEQQAQYEKQATDIVNQYAEPEPANDNQIESQTPEPGQ